MAKWSEMSWKGQAAVMIVVALCLTVVLYFVPGGYKSIADSNEDAAKSLASKRAEIAQLQPYQGKLAELNAAIDGLKQQLELQKRIVPEEKEVEGFIKVLQAEASQSNIEIRRYEAKPVETKEYYSQAPFAIDIDGPYYAVLDFFRRVGKMERIINISDLKMASVTKPSGAGVKKTYHYEPNESVVASCVATTFYSHASTPPPAKGAKKKR
ncbi:MAG: type 4a pilus biogenesis protein PilO [Terriglobia bacterium]|jgi:type IV pilus assembly protein PilO|nr:type 4a pilus biogenesis protein PilO [Terriglobia bacterium]